MGLLYRVHVTALGGLHLFFFHFLKMAECNSCIYLCIYVGIHGAGKRRAASPKLLQKDIKRELKLAPAAHMFISESEGLNTMV